MHGLALEVTGYQLQSLPSGIAPGYAGQMSGSVA